MYIAWYWWILHARQALINSRFMVHLGNDTLSRNDVDINCNYGNPLKRAIQSHSGLVSEWVYTVALALNYSLNIASCCFPIQSLSQACSTTTSVLVHSVTLFKANSIAENTLLKFS